MYIFLSLNTHLKKTNAINVNLKNIYGRLSTSGHKETERTVGVIMEVRVS